MPLFFRSSIATHRLRDRSSALVVNPNCYRLLYIIAGIVSLTMLLGSIILILSHHASPITAAALLVDYTAPSPTSYLGSSLLETVDNRTISSAEGGDRCFIVPSIDSQIRPALHLHRDAGYSRAEVKLKADFVEHVTYYLGHEFMLTNVKKGLTIMQWQRATDSATPSQTDLFALEFSNHDPPRLSLTSTPPNKSRSAVWTSPTNFTTATIHTVAFRWTTSPNANVTLWLEGDYVFTLSGVDLWPGNSFATVGLYGGETGLSNGTAETNAGGFDEWIYRVQLSNSSLDDVAEAGGLGRKGTVGRFLRGSGQAVL